MRIVGGTFGSRALVAPKGRATRPTSDRVREALFGILQSAKVVDHARVLDLYAGSGALGLEALSRGAAHATLIESSRDALDAIRTNVDALGVGTRVRVIAGDVRNVPRLLRGLTPSEPFDLVLADPPWALVDEGAALAALTALLRAGVVAPGAWIVLEHSARTAPPASDGAPPPDGTTPPDRLTPADTRRYGDTALTFYKPDILVRLSV
jgi:16S rRNA (guanine966-N2)-methyltransferase